MIKLYCWIIGSEKKMHELMYFDMLDRAIINASGVNACLPHGIVQVEDNFQEAMNGCQFRWPSDLPLLAGGWWFGKTLLKPR
jgi:hypothetical protein